MVQRKPIAYQTINDQQKPVAVSFALRGKNKIGFKLGRYDRTRKLVIDPILIFSTHFGGSTTETATSVKTDAEGYIYLTGSTASLNFPVRIRCRLVTAVKN